MNGQVTADWSATQPQGYVAPTPVQRTSPQSFAVLVLGVASLTVFWGVAGIVALVLTPGAKREIAASNGGLSGAGLIRAGVICSWISMALTVLALVAIALLLVPIGANTHTFTTPGDSGVGLVVP